MTHGNGMKVVVTTMAVVALLGVSACGKKDAAAPKANGNAEVTSGNNPATTSTKVPTTGTSLPNGFTGDTLQWATTATATTSYGTNPGDSWAASQATGAPNVTADVPADECGDIAQAWASSARDTIDMLTLGFAKAVIPTGINIRETYNPGAIVKVVVSGPTGQSATVFQGQPNKVSSCPRMFEVPVSGVSFVVNSVAVTIDQTQVQSWAEIDAVQLVGNLPSTSSSSTSSSSSTTTTVTP
jgi:hypothetical protein